MRISSRWSRLLSRHGGVRRSPAPWRPVSLRWRAVRGVPGSAPASLHVGSWSTLFFPQINLHFSKTIQAATVAAIRGNLPASTHSEHRSAQHFRTLIHRSTTWRESILRFSKPAELVLPVPQTAPTFSPATPAPVVLIHRFPTVQTLIKTVATETNRVSRMAAIAGPALHFGSARLKNRQFVQPTPEARRPAHIEVPRQLQFSPTSTMVRPPELVWRQPAKHATMSAASTEGPRSLFEATRPTRTPAPDAQTSTSRAVTSQATPPAPKFDAIQMDRLVDDVIYRVEKRVRVESERRGW